MSRSKNTTEKHHDREAFSFTAYIYQEDLRKIQELVQPYPDIETGGDLFGLWQDERTVIIQRFIGPGKECKRTATSFYQDVEYLHRVGSLITAEEGLCNVGEWHSHHQIGMPEPSGADRRTVFSNMPNLGLERFVLFIATIERAGNRGKKRSQEVELDQIKLRPFLFIGSQQKVLNGKIEIIPGENPHHINFKTEKEIKKGAEKGKDDKRQKSSGDESFDKAKLQSDKKRNGKSRDENQSPNTDRVVPRDNDSGKLSVKNGSLAFQGAGKDNSSTVVIGRVHEKGFY